MVKMHSENTDRINQVSIFFLNTLKMLYEKVLKVVTKHQRKIFFLNSSLFMMLRQKIKNS